MKARREREREREKRPELTYIFITGFIQDSAEERPLRTSIAARNRNSVSFEVGIRREHYIFDILISLSFFFVGIRIFYVFLATSTTRRACILFSSMLPKGSCTRRFEPNGSLMRKNRQRYAMCYEMTGIFEIL